MGIQAALIQMLFGALFFEDLARLLGFGATELGAVRFRLTFGGPANFGFARTAQIDDLGHRILSRGCLQPAA